VNGSASVPTSPVVTATTVISGVTVSSGGSIDYVGDTVLSGGVLPL
jgi:hypothetical protein